MKYVSRAELVCPPPNNTGIDEMRVIATIVTTHPKPVDWYFFRIK
jgi:hypothetical protein